MDIDKTAYLKQKLEAFKNRAKPEVSNPNLETENEKETDRALQSMQFIGSFFVKTSLIWASLYLLSNKFPSHFVKFGYWETALYFATAVSIISTFKSNKK